MSESFQFVSRAGAVCPFNIFSMKFSTSIIHAIACGALLCTVFYVPPGRHVPTFNVVPALYIRPVVFIPARNAKHVPSDPTVADSYVLREQDVKLCYQFLPVALFRWSMFEFKVCHNSWHSEQIMVQ